MEVLQSFWQPSAITAEQRLWLAVLETAFEDALGHNDPRQKESARRWFLDGGRNFKLVCDLANFDAGFVRKRALSIIQS